MNIIEQLSNQDFATDLVYRFFEGKYTEKEVRSLLFDLVGDEKKHIRRGVYTLAQEWKNTVNPDDEESIRKFYERTDYYIFDLVPWNGSGMFSPNVQSVINVINKLKIASVLDFGGGIGTLVIALAQEVPELEEILYVDLLHSVTSHFAQFFMEEMGVADQITILDVQEFFDSDVKANLITALDCFEHLPNLETVIDELTSRTGHIYHDSTFRAYDTSPQHIETRGDLWFLNLMASKNFLPNPQGGNQNFKWLSRCSLKFAPGPEPNTLEPAIEFRQPSTYRKAINV
jgi:hypothetical protein